MPGAWAASSSWPKYESPVPAATIKLSYGTSIAAPSGPWARTTRVCRSKPVTSASSTAAFPWSRRRWRSDVAISPSDRIPVAT